MPSSRVDGSRDDDVADVVVPRVREVAGQVLQWAGARVRRLLDAETHKSQHGQSSCKPIDNIYAYVIVSVSKYLTTVIVIKKKKEKLGALHTVLDLLELVLLELDGVLGEAEGVEGAAGVLLLLGVLLHGALVLGEGDGDELDDQDRRQRAPWHRVAEVRGLAAGLRRTLLRLHPVDKPQRLRHQHPRLHKRDSVQFSSSMAAQAMPCGDQNQEPYHSEHGPPAVVHLRLLEPLEILRHGGEAQRVEPEVTARTHGKS